MSDKITIMSKCTRSNLDLQLTDISDLQYQSLRSLMKGETTALSDVFTSMPSAQGDAELKDDNKEQGIGSIYPSQGDWDMLREYEQHRLKSIKM